MSPIAHIGFTYILVRAVDLIFHLNISTTETIFIVGVANLIDIDYLVGRLMGKSGESHHSFYTHTPIGITTVWMIISIALNMLPIEINPALYPLLLISMLFHLVLDEMQYIFYKMGLQKFQYPQINWLYPFTEAKGKNTKTGGIDKFFGTMKMNMIAEAGIISGFLFMVIYLAK